MNPPTGCKTFPLRFSDGESWACATSVALSNNQKNDKSEEMKDSGGVLCKPRRCCDAKWVVEVICQGTA